MPIMLVMLQSPSDQTRVYAARALSMLPPEAYTAVTTAILTSPVDVLGHLLTQLSGDAPSTNRSWYAALMGQCTPRFDPPELKKISDAGAVPYLLKLLQEANGQKSKIRTLRCLSVGCRSYVPPWHTALQHYTACEASSPCIHLL